MKLIDIKKLTFEYFRRDDEGNVEEAVEALSDVTLDVAQGEFVAIVGRNGSGKSTLAKHINALLLPEEGEVIVDGMDVEDEELRLTIRKTAGMVFQNPDNQIVANIVEEDVAFGPENIGVPTSDIWNRVDMGLNATDMQSYRKMSPSHLSGGQKQRVAIAGVLAMEPKCIIFDEATSMLDPQGRKQIIEVARKLQLEKNITIILITHHMDEVLYADKVFAMKDGKVMGQGRPDELFANKELLADCGLSLPPFYQYIHFLIGQGIATASELENVHDIRQLADLLITKYKGKNILDDENKGARKENIELNGDVSKGILLHSVTHTYNKGYADEVSAIKDIDLSIHPAEFVAIIGHTGSGKSTLMQHLNGLLLPTSGNVYFDGCDITDSDFSLKSLRQKVGMVFQYPEHQLFAETVEKDVSFGPLNMNISKVEAQKRAYEAIRMVGLPDTIYDYSPLQLSGGQKRRVAIAGVLALGPDYLILDEPTAGLDPEAARELLTMLKKLQNEEKMTIVVVSHSMEEVAEYADRIVVLEDGLKKYDGRVWEIFGQKDALKQMGLDIPVGIELLHLLNESGLMIDYTKYRSLDICGELLKLVL